MLELAKKLTEISDGNPLKVLSFVSLLYLLFNVFEGAIETLIWGKPFFHVLDYLFIALFAAYAVYAMYVSTFYKR